MGGVRRADVARGTNREWTSITRKFIGAVAGAWAFIVAGPASAALLAYDPFTISVGDTFLAVDLSLNSFSGINELTLAVTTASGTLSIAVSGGGLDLDALAGVHLVVLNLEFDPVAPDVVSLFLDPTDSIESNYTPAASISVATSDLFITHHGAFTPFTFSGAGHVPGAFDEVRWGDTFADVTSFLTVTEVPEPATLPLFAAGLFGMILMGGRSRRRRRLDPAW